MSQFSLEETKEFLRVTHALDDAVIQRLLESAEREALDYMDRPAFGLESSSDEDGWPDGEIPAPVRTAVMLLVQSGYEATADERPKFREAAETLLSPYRLNLGV